MQKLTVKKRNHNPRDNAGGAITLCYIRFTLYQQDSDGKLIDMDVNNIYLSSIRYYTL